MGKQASSSSEGVDKYQLMDEKKRKRMIQNRKSAKQSRMRKAQHIHDLNSEITFLRVNNNKLVQKITSLEQQLSATNLENQKLMKEQDELATRVEALEIVSSYVCGYEKESLPCSSQLNIPPQTLPLMASVGKFNFD